MNRSFLPGVSSLFRIRWGLSRREQITVRYTHLKNFVEKNCIACKRESVVDRAQIKSEMVSTLKLLQVSGVFLTMFSDTLVEIKL